MMSKISNNLDPATVQGFGEEWAAFDQTGMSDEEHRTRFDEYFCSFPLNPGEEGFDLGCGSGRWAELVAPQVRKLHCIEPSPKALAVARKKLEGQSNAFLHSAGVDDAPLADGSQDFGYVLGVLHHVPDTRAALVRCAKMLKPGGRLLVYLYYNFDNRPWWFRAIWKASDIGRAGVSRLPFSVRKRVTDVIAATIYYPLARSARLFERAGMNVSAFPLSAYRDLSLYTMRTDALDRFGTRLEHRFSKAEIQDMMREAGLTRIRFNEGVPHWVAQGVKADTSRRLDCLKL